MTITAAPHRTARETTEAAPRPEPSTVAATRPQGRLHLPGALAGDAPQPSTLAAMLRRAKRAYTTRRVDLGRARALRSDLAPQRGDLVLARVGVIGQHARIELPEGRRAPLLEGDLVVVAFADRYAPDQFEAIVPDDLGPCSLVAGGGIAGRVLAQHARMLPATELVPLGLLSDAEGRILNVADGAIAPEPCATKPPVIAVVGAAMNSGKTTTVAKVVAGLTAAGLRVGAVKVTGTGAGGDVWSFRDHGAAVAYDFTDFGHASTAGVGVEAVADVLERGVARLAREGCEAVVVEVADGVFQQETAALVEHAAFARLVDGVLFAATDALCGLAGESWLAERGHAPLGISGVITASPLATRELRGATACPVWDIVTLSDAEHASSLLDTVRERASR